MKVLNENNLSSLYQKIKSYMAVKDDILDIIYPINSIYMSTNSTSPATLFGGTWTRWALGKVLVGQQPDTTEITLDSSEEVILTTSQMPSHNHGEISLTGNVWNISDQGTSARCNPTGILSKRASNEQVGYCSSEGKNDTLDGFDIDLSHTHNAEGSNQGHNNLQPYITCYMWKRTG